MSSEDDDAGYVRPAALAMKAGGRKRKGGRKKAMATKKTAVAKKASARKKAGGMKKAAARSVWGGLPGKPKPPPRPKKK